MPAITRLQSQRSYNLLSTVENGGSNLSSKSSTKKVRECSYATAPSSYIQKPVALKKPRKPKGAHSSSQKPRNLPRKHQSPDRGKKSRTATRIPLPELSEGILTEFACKICSCPQGAFDYPVNSCIHCEHKMEEHDKCESRWDHNCRHACERNELIVSIMRLLDTIRVVIIRATPQSGKSVLLMLLGDHVLHGRRDLEPVFIHWQTQSQRKQLPYKDYLVREKLSWRKSNAKERPCNPNAQTLYLIDEAQQSYEDTEFWARELKNRRTKSQPMFVLVCLYGADVSFGRSPTIESLSLTINPVQHVALRPSVTNNPYILFTLEETTVVVQKWAMGNNYEVAEGLYDYLQVATDGHPGMVGFVLSYFDDYRWKASEATRHSLRWTPERCHELLVNHQDMIADLTRWERGLWTTKAENVVHSYMNGDEFRKSRFEAITFSDVVNTLRQVATQPQGYTPKSRSAVLDFCHHVGYLYMQQIWPGSDMITYTFASPIHRRVAYRRLCPGSEPGSASRNLTLREACLNAIGRFSPSALQSRSTQSREYGGVPEAAFQDELYCALNYELQNSPVLSEYAHTKGGRIDFFVFDEKWGIEVLQSGDASKIAEHAARFAAGGKYSRWNILKDYIILNFCSKSMVRSIEIEDVQVQSRILQVVVDSNKYIAEVYSHDKNLIATSTLGEGRQLFEPDKEPPPRDSGVIQIGQNQNTLFEDLRRQVREAQQVAREAQQVAREAQQEVQDARRQLKQI